ncbi:MAG: hypothetical protein ACFFCM_06420 [Promethearchaeota archaeon]
MIHNVCIMKKITGGFLFYKDYWNIYKDYQSILKIFTAYIPFLMRNEEGTIRILKQGEEFEFHFGNYELIVIIFGVDKGTDKEMIRDFMERISNNINIIYDSKESLMSKDLPPGMDQFSKEIELMVRASPNYEELYKLDKTVEQRINITPASEELNRRNTMFAEQGFQLKNEFFCEFTSDEDKMNVVTRPKFYMTSKAEYNPDSSKIEAKSYEIYIDFLEYPKRPTFPDFPKGLYNIIGDPYQALETLREWDIVHPPAWVELVRELEQKVYKSETHLIEPIIEQPYEPGKKGKGKGEAAGKAKGDQKKTSSYK